MERCPGPPSGCMRSPGLRDRIITAPRGNHAVMLRRSCSAGATSRERRNFQLPHATSAGSGPATTALDAQPTKRHGGAPFTTQRHPAAALPILNQLQRPLGGRTTHHHTDTQCQCPQHRACHIGRIPLQRAPSNGNALALPLQIEPGQVRQRVIPRAPPLRRRCRNAAEVSCHVGPALLQHRQQLVPDPGAIVTQVFVRGVRPVCHALIVQVPRQLLPPERQQWTENRPAPRLHARQPGRTGAPQHPHEDCFGLVVAVVRRHDEIGTAGNTHPLECRPAR